MVFLTIESNKLNGNEPILVIDNQLPLYAYPQEFIECTIHIENIENIKFPLLFHIALVHADTKLTTETSTHLTIDPATPLEFQSEICTFRFQLNHIVKNMCLRCYLPDPYHMISVLTSPFTIVQEKLVITQQPPDVWFKDEGGRDKCMIVQVQVEAAPGKTVISRIIPLELSLLYDSGEIVHASASATSPSNGILKLFPDLRPNITDGKVRISFRIEDVSKNHQNHSFVLKISPESSNVYADISNVCTDPVAIRSKRNKRRLAGLKSPSNASTIVTPSSSHRPRMLPTPVHATPTNNTSTPYDKTPIGSKRNTTPHNLPRGRPSWSDTMEEWKLIGYEIHTDGSLNKQAPIYRCMTCMTLTDASQQATHLSTCTFYKQRQQHNTPRPQRVQTPQMVYGYNHSFLNQSTQNNQTPMSNQSNTPMANAYTPTNVSYTPSHHQNNGFSKPEPNIFLTASKPHTPSTTEASAKPMMMMDMYLTAAANSNWPMQMVAMNNGTQQHYTHPQESYIAYILAVVHTDMQGEKMGLPAFDQYRQLLGFYKDGQGMNQQRTQIIFSPSSEFPFCDTTSVCTAFEQAIQFGSPAAFSLTKCMGNLVKLQEAAFMHLWSQNLMQ